MEAMLLALADMEPEPLAAGSTARYFPALSRPTITIQWWRVEDEWTGTTMGRPLDTAASTAAFSSLRLPA